MKTLIRVAVRWAILFSLCLNPILTAPSTLHAQGCQDLLPKGTYEGTTTVNMVISGFEEGNLVQQFTYGDTGELSLTVDCAISAGSYRWQVKRTLMFFPGEEPIDCDYTIEMASTGTVSSIGDVVVGPNSLPRLDVTWPSATTLPNDCVDAGPTPGTTWLFSLGQPPQGRTISGDFRYSGPDLMDYEELATMFRAQGFEVTLSKSWTLTRKAQPTVKSFGSSLRQLFLAGIPVTNQYSATIDWDNAEAGTARFILGGNTPRAMSVNGNSATITQDLTAVAGTGDFPITIEAELEGRIDRMDGLGPLTLVPVPSWATIFNLQPQLQSDHVKYSGGFALPEKPLDAHVVLPSLLPFVGGTWGLLPTQLKLLLVANSLGTRETGGLSAQGGFGLGKKIYILSASGNIHGQITHDALTFASDELVLSTPPIALQERLGLLSVIPGISALFSVPVVGDFLQGLDSTLGVTAEIHGQMTGRGQLGVTGEKLALTQGSFDATLGVLASGGIDTPLVTLIVTGGGDGQLTMQFAPTTKLISCRILLSFQARAAALGKNLGQFDSSWPLFTCPVGGGQSVLLLVDPQIAGVRSASELADSAAIEAVSSRLQITNGISETVLVENARLDARPVLAVGPKSKMALVWNSAGNGGEVDQVSVRLFDGSAWANPVIVSQPDRYAFTPSASFSQNGTLLIAWAETRQPADPAGLTVAFARSLDIAWAEIDGASGAVIRRGTLAEDDVMDFGPQLVAGRDGSVWLVWQQSPGTNAAGTVAQPNQWRASRWDGTGWTDGETAGENGVGTLFWRAAAVDRDRLWLAADVDMDGNMATADDREIYLYQRTAAGWAAPLRVTTDAVVDSGPLLAVTADGWPLLAWRHGETILGLSGDPASVLPGVWFDEATSAGPMLGSGQLLVDASGSPLLLWAAGTGQGQDIWLARLSDQGWSQPAPLFQTPEQRRSLSASLLPGGEIALGLIAAPIVTQTVTFEGGITGPVPVIGERGSLIVARILSGTVPVNGSNPLFLPVVARR